MKKLKVSKEEVEYVASLARLTLTEEENEIYTVQFNNILDYINLLNELNLEGIEPTTYVQPVNNVFRKDTVKKNSRDLLGSI